MSLPKTLNLGSPLELEFSTIELVQQTPINKL